MSLEFTPSKKEVYLPNKVADFVVEEVENFEELNAPNLEEGEKKFRQALAKALEKNRLFETGERGEAFLIHTINEINYDAPFLVKRLRTKTNQGYARIEKLKLSPDELFDLVKKEYDIVNTYFGPRFLPPYEAVVLEGGQRIAQCFDHDAICNI